MAKLTSLKPAISFLPPRIGYAPGDEKARDKHRRETLQSKTWLKSAWWLKARQRILLRDRYQCCKCKAIVAGKGEAHIDHIIPHNEDRSLFFCADDGLQTLCVPCHVKVKQAEERNAGMLR